jgi:hypothetical protein
MAKSLACEQAQGVLWGECQQEGGRRASGSAQGALFLPAEQLVGPAAAAAALEYAILL